MQRRQLGSRKFRVCLLHVARPVAKIYLMQTKEPTTPYGKVNPSPPPPPRSRKQINNSTMSSYARKYTRGAAAEARPASGSLWHAVHPSFDSPNTSRRFALGASDVCLARESPTCSVSALWNATVYGHSTTAMHGRSTVPPHLPIVSADNTAKPTQL